ncbi:MAG: hypothetical protein ABIQ75_08820, partial [Flavobacteriales bacterium]
HPTPLSADMERWAVRIDPLNSFNEKASAQVEAFFVLLPERFIALSSSEALHFFHGRRSAGSLVQPGKRNDRHAEEIPHS